MAVTLPTVDDFTETTVLTMIRKIVDYLCSDSGLVAQINNNDITGFTSSYTNNLLKIDATKGDGTKIPVCSLTIEGGSSTGNPYPTGISGTVGADGNITFTINMSSGSPLTTTINMNYFASADDLSDLQEQVSGIKPTVTVNSLVSPPTITVAVNGTSSTANLPSMNGLEWEILDISNMPTDFENGDIIFACINGVVRGSASDWNSPVENVTIANGLSATYFGVLKDSVIYNMSTLNIIFGGCIALNNISAYSASSWNTGSYFAISGAVFNGNSMKKSSGRDIDSSNASDYIKLIARLKVGTLQT